MQTDTQKHTYLERGGVLGGAEAGDLAVGLRLQDGLDLLVHDLGEDDACVEYMCGGSGSVRR